jgi:hypothetical protein
MALFTLKWLPEGLGRMLLRLGFSRCSPGIRKAGFASAWSHLCLTMFKSESKLLIVKPPTAVLVTTGSCRVVSLTREEIRRRMC